MATSGYQSLPGDYVEAIPAADDIAAWLENYKAEAQAQAAAQAAQQSILDQYIADQAAQGKTVVSLNPYNPGGDFSDQLNYALYQGLNPVTAGNVANQTGQVFRFTTNSDNPGSAPAVLRPGETYTLTDYKGNVIGSASTPEQMQALVDMSGKMDASGWKLFSNQGMYSTPGSAATDPANELFSNTPQDNTLKNIAIAAATAMGAAGLGPFIQGAGKIAPGLVGAAATPVGAGLAAAGTNALANLATGASLGEALKSGALSGLTTGALTGLTQAVIPAKPTPGSSFLDAAPATATAAPVAPAVASAVTPDVINVIGNIASKVAPAATVAAPIVSGITQAALNEAFDNTFKQQQPTDGENVVIAPKVTPAPAPVPIPVTVPTSPLENVDTNTIDVTAKKPVVPFVPPVSITPTPPPPGVTPAETTTPAKDKGLTTKDYIRLGLLAPSLIKGVAGLLGAGEDNTVITPESSAVKYNPLNRTQTISGIGNTPAFDVFTYGQDMPSAQKGEFEFFTPYTTNVGPQTYTPVSSYDRYTQADVDAANANLLSGYNAGLSNFNAYQDTLAQQVASGALTPEAAQAAAGQYAGGLGYTTAALKEGGTPEDDGEMSDDMVKHLIEWNKGNGHKGPGQVKGIGSGQEDLIPAWLSDGEYVWSAQDVADLGDGSTDEGVRRLDKMRQMVRGRAGRKDVKKIAKPQRGIDHMLKAVGGKV